MKHLLSALTAITSAGDDDLLYVADTADGGKVTPLKSYKFIDIFPVAVSSIDLSYDSSDTIEEFTVEFAVQSFESLSTDQTGVNLK